MTEREKFILDLINMNVIDQRQLLEMGIELLELQALRSKKWISQRSVLYSVAALGHAELKKRKELETPYKMALPREYNSMTGVYTPPPHPFKERFRP
jgi:hypothetical protein